MLRLRRILFSLLSDNTNNIIIIIIWNSNNNNNNSSTLFGVKIKIKTKKINFGISI
jgi:hypothetical protein